MKELEQEIQKLPFNLYRTAIAIRGELSRRLTSYFGDEFTADFWFILSAVFEHDGIVQTELSKILNRDTASISRTLSCMERLDLITRTKETPNSRSTKISPTKLAHEFKPQAESIIKETLGLNLEKLKPIEIIELNRILNDIFDKSK